MAKGGGAEVGATKRGKGMSHRRMKRLSRRRSCVGGFAAIGAVWRDQLDPVSSQFIVERVAVVGAITDQIFWLGFNHVEVEAQLHQANFMMIGGVRAYRKRQSMTIDNRHDFHAFSALRCAHFCPTAFSHYECRIDEAFFFIERTCREARWQHPSAPAARSHRGTKSGSVAVPFCNSDSSAGACAIARLCSESTEPPQAPDVSE